MLAPRASLTFDGPVPVRPCSTRGGAPSFSSIDLIYLHTFSSPFSLPFCYFFFCCFLFHSSLPSISSMGARYHPSFSSPCVLGGSRKQPLYLYLPSNITPLQEKRNHYFFGKGNIVIQERYN